VYENKFKVISAAYDVLKTEDNKAVYDRLREEHFSMKDFRASSKK